MAQVVVKLRDSEHEGLRSPVFPQDVAENLCHLIEREMCSHVVDDIDPETGEHVKIEYKGHCQGTPGTVVNLWPQVDPETGQEHPVHNVTTLSDRIAQVFITEDDPSAKVAGQHELLEFPDEAAPQEVEA